MTAREWALVPLWLTCALGAAMFALPQLLLLAVTGR